MCPGAEQAPPEAAVGSGRPELATAAPWLTSDSRRRPPRGCGGGKGPVILPRLRCHHLRGRQVIVRGPDGQGLPRATARLSIRPEPQAGRKDGQLAVTESRPVRMSQNPSDPSNRSGSAVPEVHLYCYNKGHAKGPKPIACGNLIP